MIEMFKSKAVILILLFGLIIRLAIAFGTGSFTQPTVFEYEETAQNIIAGKGFCEQIFGTKYYAYLEPFYPFLVAFFYRFTPFDKAGLIILQIFTSTLLGVIIYLIAKDIFSHAVGVMACILTILHPGLIIYSTQNLHPLIFDAFLFGLLILAFFRVNNLHGIWAYIGAGLVLGITILARSTVILFIPLAYLWLSLNPAHSKKTKFVALFTITLIALVVISPWQIRNQIRFKKFVFISSSKGQLLWRGNNINASGTLWYGDKTYIAAMPEKLKEKIRDKGELEQDRIFREEAFTFIRKHPLTFLRLWGEKFYYFWWFSPYAGNQYPAVWFSIYRFYYSIMFVTFIIGMSRSLCRCSRDISFKVMLPILLMISISLLLVTLV